MSSTPTETYKYYHYDPSLAAAVLFTVLFGLSTLWHLILISKHKTWYFVPVVIGGIFEIVGYAARAVSNSQAPVMTLGPYVIQTLLLLVAPPLFAASIYMILGRIITTTDGESFSLIKLRWLTTIFVTSDAVTFVIQLAGAGLMSSATASTSVMGSRIVLAGLLLQIVIFGFFMVVSLVFHVRLRARPTSQSLDAALPWKKFMYILYMTCALILIRSIVRVAEFAEGFSGYIILHEVFLYVFDAVPMVAMVFTFNIWYPSVFSTRARKTPGSIERIPSHIELSKVVC